MKIKALAIVLALGAGVTLGSSPAFAGETGVEPTAQEAVPAKKLSLKNMFKRKQAKTDVAKKQDQRAATQAMGAGPGTNLGDRARQTRMDDAYANWRARQGRS
ncbi:MAG TPA: hypothetical protein VLJ58_21880 [Ramlibacter sp.]|nr:hypothetical protein [Ramlibacter sp.]